MKNPNEITEQFSNQTREEIIDLAILKNITGGNNGTSKCCQNGWKETCGTSGGDWCGKFENPV
jgi:hypothetical protein